MHLILSSAFQKPSNTKLVSLHYKSDRRCSKLCCEYPACCFALIESMQHEPRQREVVTPCICCLACTETQSWDVWNMPPEGEEDAEDQRGDHACQISSIFSEEPLHSFFSYYIQSLLEATQEKKYVLEFSGDSPSGAHTHYGKVSCLSV